MATHFELIARYLADEFDCYTQRCYEQLPAEKKAQFHNHYWCEWVPDEILDCMEHILTVDLTAAVSAAIKETHPSEIRTGHMALANLILAKLGQKADEAVERAMFEVYGNMSRSEIDRAVANPVAFLLGGRS